MLIDLIAAVTTFNLYWTTRKIQAAVPRAPQTTCACRSTRTVCPAHRNQCSASNIDIIGLTSIRAHARKQSRAFSAEFSLPGISTELQVKEQVGRREQCETSPAEPCGVASTAFIQKGHQNVHRPLILGSSESAFTAVHGRFARDHAESLSTGKKVNTALDNPTNFFTAQALDSRASDISNLLDGIGNGVQILQQANNGLTSLQKLVDSAKSLANQALQTTVGFSTKSSVSTTVSGATSADLRGSTSFTNTTAVGNVLFKGTAGGTTPATPQAR